MNKTTVAQQAKTSSDLPHVQGLLQRKCACGNDTMGGGECEECAKKMRLQRKLAVEVSNDPLEREDDQVEDQVMAMLVHSEVSGIPPRIQHVGRISEA